MSDQTMHRPEQAQAQRWAQQMGLESGQQIYPSSFIVKDSVTAFSGRQGSQRSLYLVWKGTSPAWVEKFEGTTAEIKLDDQVMTSKRCPTNSANAAVSARLAAPGAARVGLPFETRELAADGGVFEDAFGPYGVHVYTWE